MISILGLGNPEEEYKNTRHNVGHMFIDYLSTNRPVSKCRMFHTIMLDNETTLVKPMNYINCNGEVIKLLGTNKNWLIVSDDLDTPLGEFRVKFKGSDGGHNGLKSVEQALGTQKYARLKLGIGPRPQGPLGDFVTGKFSKEDLETLNNVFKLAILDLKFHKLLQ